MENRPKFFSYRHLLSAASFVTGIYDPNEVMVVQPDFEQILVFNAMRRGGHWGTTGIGPSPCLGVQIVAFGLT